MQKEAPMNTQAIHSKNGKTYWVETGDTLYAQRLQSGQYQSTNWTFAQTVIPQFRRAIDIGSNNACNAIHYAERFDVVECFEPTPLAIELWKNTVRDNAVVNTRLYETALGERPTKTKIICHEKNGGHNHLSHYDKNPRAHIKNLNRATVDVEVRTLDSYNFADVDFIKIDVEGYEWFVLQGAETTLLQNRPVLQLEIVANQCRKFNYEAEQMIEWLRERDYAVVSKRDGHLDGKFQGKGTRLYYNGVARKGDMDLFFVPQEHNMTLQPTLELFEWGV